MPLHAAIGAVLLKRAAEAINRLKQKKFMNTKPSKESAIDQCQI